MLLTTCYKPSKGMYAFLAEIKVCARMWACEWVDDGSGCHVRGQSDAEVTKEYTGRLRKCGSG